MQLPPASVLASWPTPNHVNPDTRGHIGMVVGILLATLVTITLLIRLYSRIWLTKGFGLDDILMSLAYFPATAFTIVGVVAEGRIQWNRHTWDVDIELIVPGLQLSLASQILFDLATNLTKLSILTLLYRLTTASRDRIMTVSVLVMIVLICLVCFIFIIVSIFQCTPLSEFWELSDKPQECINQSAHIIAASIINTFTDWVVVLLPIKAALCLNIPTKQSSMIIFLFGVGILASSAGIARTYFTWVLATDFDITWNSWTVWFSSAIELNLGIICASIPATKPFFASYLPGVFGSTFRPRSPGSMGIDWDRKPLTHSPSLTTFIDQSSSSSTFLPHRPPPPTPYHKPANLNKPLPPIAYNQHTDPETRSTLSDEFSLCPHSPNMALPQRASLRLSDQNRRLVPSSSQPRDRTTIFIMYRADSDPGPTQKTPMRASLA
ncbi:integral membrane protein [Hypoxylon fuscum]|nr:integral membrane protein [Hypoxylon fuscum]